MVAGWEGMEAGAVGVGVGLLKKALHTYSFKPLLGVDLHANGRRSNAEAAVQLMARCIIGNLSRVRGALSVGGTVHVTQPIEAVSLFNQTQAAVAFVNAESCIREHT